jgi:hypothetical protein
MLVLNSFSTLAQQAERQPSNLYSLRVGCLGIAYFSYYPHIAYCPLSEPEMLAIFML